MPAKRSSFKPKQCRVIVHYQGKRAIQCGIYLDEDGYCSIHGKQA